MPMKVGVGFFLAWGFAMLFAGVVVTALRQAKVLD
jgi:hypothetical protein